MCIYFFRGYEGIQQGQTPISANRRLAADCTPPPRRNRRPLAGELSYSDPPIAPPRSLSRYAARHASAAGGSFVSGKQNRTSGAVLTGEAYSIVARFMIRFRYVAAPAETRVVSWVLLCQRDKAKSAQGSVVVSLEYSMAADTFFSSLRCILSILLMRLILSLRLHLGINTLAFGTSSLLPGLGVSSATRSTARCCRHTEFQPHKKHNTMSLI